MWGKLPKINKQVAVPIKNKKNRLRRRIRRRRKQCASLGYLPQAAEGVSVILLMSKVKATGFSNFFVKKPFSWAIK
jgi:hypothetical protein